MGGMMSRMNGMFDPENKFWMFMEKVTNVMGISLLWLICSLPIVTMGAATTAVFQYTLHQVRDEEGYVWNGFFKAFKQNFRQATVLWLGILATGGFLLYDLDVCMQIPLPRLAQIPVLMVLGCAVILWVLTVIYILPILACFQVTTKQAVRDAFVMAVSNLPVSLVILAVYAGFAILAVLRPAAAVFCVGLAIFVSSYLFHFVFWRYVKPWSADEMV